MPDAVYQVMTMLSTLVAPLPIGTNLGLLHLLWMLVSGRLLGSRGALFAGLGGTRARRVGKRRVAGALGGRGPRGGAVAAVPAWRLPAGRGRCHRVLAP